MVCEVCDDIYVRNHKFDHSNENGSIHSIFLDLCECCFAMTKGYADYFKSCADSLCIKTIRECIKQNIHKEKKKYFDKMFYRELFK